MIYSNKWFELYDVEPNEYGFVAVRHQLQDDKQYRSYGCFYTSGPTIKTGWYAVHASTTLYPLKRKEDGTFEGMFLFLA